MSIPRAALAECCKSGDATVCRRIISGSGVDIKGLLEATDNDGWAGIHHAASGGHIALVGELLQKAKWIEMSPIGITLL